MFLFPFHLLTPEQREATRMAGVTRVNDQWPKRCGCTRTYRQAGWARLELVQSPHALDGRQTDAFATFELRNCSCGSTLAALVEIHSLAAE